MLWLFIISFLVTIVLEILIVIHTIAIAERRRKLASSASSIIELMKFSTIIFLLEAPTLGAKIALACVTALACGIGSYVAIWIMDRWEKKYEDDQKYPKDH